jgi:hypothetical protein
MGASTQKVFWRFCYASRKRSKLAPNGPTWASAYRDVVADVPSRSIGGLAAGAATVFRRGNDFAARTLVLVAVSRASKSVATSGTDRGARPGLGIVRNLCFFAVAGLFAPSDPSRKVGEVGE